MLPARCMCVPHVTNCYIFSNAGNSDADDDSSTAASHVAATRKRAAAATSLFARGVAERRMTEAAVIRRAAQSAKCTIKQLEKVAAKTAGGMSPFEWAEGHLNSVRGAVENDQFDDGEMILSD